MSVAIFNAVRSCREKLRSYVHPDWKMTLSPTGACHDCGEPVRGIELFCSHCNEPPII